MVDKVAVSSSVAGLLILFDQTVPLASKFLSLWLGTGFVARRTFCTELPISLRSSFSTLYYRGISNTVIDVNDLKTLKSLEDPFKGFPMEEGLSVWSVLSQVA